MTNRRNQHDAGSAVRALVDVLVYAPLGFGAMLIEDAPKAFEQARQELSNARFVGRFTVDQGVAQIRNRIDAAADAGRSVPDIQPSMVKRNDEPVATSESPSAGAAVDGPDDPPHSAIDLALPDYDTLPAIDIVAKLDTLDVEERGAIERYETAHRQRRTILGKLTQLAAE